MAEPTLKFLHSEGTLNRGKLELFRRFSSEELRASLAPGQQGSLKVRLDGVIGAFSYGGRRGKAKLLNPEDQDWAPVYHPVIRTHPETGRKSLYFDPGKIGGFVGIEDAESDELIAELKERMITPDAVNPMNQPDIMSEKRKGSINQPTAKTFRR